MASDSTIPIPAEPVEFDSDSSSLTAVLNPTTERRFGSELVASGITENLVTFSPALTGKRIAGILVGGDGDGEFRIKIGADDWALIRNAWNDRSKFLELGGLLLSTSDTITVDVTNVAIGGGSCTYEAYVYLAEESP